MLLVLSILGVVSLLEFSLWLPSFWRWRKQLSGLLIPALAVTSGLLLGRNLTVWVVLVAFCSLYRIVNLLRLLESRAAPKYLLRNGRQASWVLLVAQLIIALGGLSSQQMHSSGIGWLYGVMVLQLVTAAVILTSTQRQLRTTRPSDRVPAVADHDLPTLTVAIPARNETDDLEACLQSLTSSDYPKLEILVLDDCSQVRRTPEIIRTFAHDGVRFIAGKVPPEAWLAKNYAYQQLAAAASGDYLLFCGVDVRFEPRTVRELVQTLLAKQKRMLSVIPANELPGGPWSIEPLLVQPSRYAWELALPRRLLNRPPVLSTCWLISRAELQDSGGFEAVRHSISPESYFARQTIRHADGYSFIQSVASSGLRCQKTLTEQRATAVRSRYPQLHRRPELVALVSLTEIVFVLGPYILVVVAGWLGDWSFALVGALSALAWTLSYSRIVNLTYRRRLLRGVWLLPLAVIYDLGLLNLSMWRYEFNQVIWKDRNICLPILQTPNRQSPDSLS